MKSECSPGFASKYCWSIAFGLLALSGCSKQLDSSYGNSDGSAARRSPAGMSLFRNLCEAQQRDTVIVRTLSPRASDKLKGIVWAPDQFYQHRPQTLTWIDRWLSHGDRTLVYIGRDYQPMFDYWRQIAIRTKEDRPSEHLIAAEFSAYAKAEIDRRFVSCRNYTLLPWCVVQHEVAVPPILNVQGELAENLDLDPTHFYLRSRPIAWSPEIRKELEEDFKALQKKSTKVSNTSVSAPPVPTSASSSFAVEWHSDDEAALKMLESIDPEGMPTWTSLLQTNNGDSLIASITSRKWKNSRVVFVANASMTCNLALLRKDARQVANRVIDMLPNDTIGFLSGDRDPTVRDNDDFEQQKGFEMLTVWPLNVITIHAVFLGALMLLAVFPIFGRAKKLPPKATQDFGQHVDAVGSLLNKSKDRFYAKTTIADYFRIVRKEPTSPWAQLDENQNDSTSPFKPTAN